VDDVPLEKVRVLFSRTASVVLFDDFDEFNNHVLESQSR
jgi:hypothetical protein